MDLVQVDVIGAEPPERALDLARDPQTRVAVIVLTWPHLPMDLRRERDAIAPPLERLPDYLLRLTVGIDVCGVDEVDPGVEGPVDDADAIVVVGVPPAAEHHGAQAVCADADAGGAERSVFHRSSRWSDRSGGQPLSQVPEAERVAGLHRHLGRVEQ